MERDTVLYMREKWKLFTIRIPSRAQRGPLRFCDAIACPNPIFIQAKYKKKYMTKEEIAGLEALAKEWNGTSMLSWRDRGIQTEMLYLPPLP